MKNKNEFKCHGLVLDSQHKNNIYNNTKELLQTRQTVHLMAEDEPKL